MLCSLHFLHKITADERRSLTIIYSLQSKKDWIKGGGEYHISYLYTLLPQRVETNLEALKPRATTILYLETQKRPSKSIEYKTVIPKFPGLISLSFSMFGIISQKYQ